MSPPNEVFQTIPFDATSDVTEPFIAAVAAEEEDYRLQEKALSRFKFSSLLLGLLFGFFYHFSTLGVKYLVISPFGAKMLLRLMFSLTFLFGASCFWPLYLLFWDSSTTC
jgi:hypothetical protein